MLNRITEFWRRNKGLIISILILWWIMNLCGRLILPPTQPKPVTEAENSTSLSSPDSSLQNMNFDEIRARRIQQEKEKGSSLLTLLFWLSALILTAYYLYRKGWLPNILPQWVSFKASLLEQRSSGRLLMRISIINKTRESKTFMHPYLFFKHWDNKRSFKIKNNLFPLTLTPGTAHSLTIDVQQFWDKVPNLKKYKRIGAMIKCSEGKTYKTIAYPKWYVKKRV